MSKITITAEIAPKISSTDITRGLAVYCAESRHDCADYRLGVLAEITGGLVSDSAFSRDYARDALEKIAEMGRDVHRASVE